MSRTCVVLGNLNPAILTPQWIVREGILADGKTTTAVGMAGESVSLKHELGGVTWVPMVNKLVVEVGEDGDAGEFVARIFEKLDHTPVRALGNNFDVRIAEQAERLASLCRFGLAEVLSAGSHPLLRTSVGLRLKGPEAGIQINISVDDPADVVKFNFHREVAKTEALIQGARQWRSDEQRALRLLDLIGRPN